MAPRLNNCNVISINASAQKRLVKGTLMEYGKPFGVGASGGVVVLGFSIGYGWIIFAGLVTTIVVIAAIRHWFRHKKPLGLK